VVKSDEVDTHSGRIPPQPRISTWERLLVRLILALGRSVEGADGRRHPRGILRVFHLVDLILERLHPMHHVRPGGVLRYEIIALPGRSLPLSGQPAIRHKERVIGLHFDSRAIAALNAATPSSQAMTWQLARESVKDLRALADLTRTDLFPADVRAVWAESVLYRAFARYGFAVRPAPPTLRTPFARLFLLTLMAMYGRTTPDRLGREYQLRLDLGEAWMDLDELRRRFSVSRTRVGSGIAGNNGARGEAGSAYAFDALDQHTAEGRADRREEKERSVAD
jgi:hypothetical protein